MEDDDSPRTNYSFCTPFQDDYLTPPMLALPSVIFPTVDASVKLVPQNRNRLSDTGVLHSTPVTDQNAVVPLQERLDPNLILSTISKQNEILMQLQQQVCELSARQDEMMRRRPHGSLYYFEEKRVEKSLIDKTNGVTTQSQSVDVVTNRVVGNQLPEDLIRRLKDEIIKELRTTSDCRSSVTNSDVSGRAVSLSKDNQFPDKVVQKKYEPEEFSRMLTPRKMSKKPEPYYEANQQGASNQLSAASSASDVSTPGNDSSILSLRNLRLDTIDEQTSIVQEPVVVDIEEYQSSDSEDESEFRESAKDFGQALKKVKNIIEQKKQVSFVPSNRLCDEARIIRKCSQPVRRTREEVDTNKENIQITPIRKATIDQVRKLEGGSIVRRTSKPCSPITRTGEPSPTKSKPSEVSMAMSRLTRKYLSPNGSREEVLEQAQYTSRTYCSVQSSGNVPSSFQMNSSGDSDISLSTRQYLEKYGLLKH